MHRITFQPSTSTKHINYEVSSETSSTCLPLPFEGTGETPLAVSDVGGGEGAVASCHEGMDGLPVNAGNGVEGELARALGPRLSKRALSDLSSC